METTVYKNTLFIKANKESFDRLKPLFPNDFDDRFQQFSSRRIDIYAVLIAGEPVGRIIANYTNQHLDNETLPNVRVCLSHFILLKDFRNQGFGSQLLRFVIDDLITHGYTEFTVGVEDANHVAKHIYFRNGFVEKINHGSIPCEYDLYCKRID